MGEITQDDVRRFAAKGKVKKLVQAAQSDDPWVRTPAIDALVELRDPKTVPAIMAALEREYYGNERTAALAVGAFADARDMPLFAALLGSRHLLLRDAAKTVLPRTAGGYPALIAALGSDDAICRRGAAQALGGQGSPESVEPLCAALDDEDEDVRAACAEALAAIGDERAVPAVGRALARTYEDADAKATVAKALATLNGDQSAPAPGETVKVVVKISGAMHGSTGFLGEYDATLPVDLDGPALLNSLAVSILHAGQVRYYTGYQLACPGGTLRSSGAGETTKPVTLRDAGVKDGDTLEFLDWGGSFV